LLSLSLAALCEEEEEEEEETRFLSSGFILTLKFFSFARGDKKKRNPLGKTEKKI